MSNKKIRLLICSLYLALGPSVWFASFRLGPIKNALLVLLCLMSLSLFISQKRRTYFIFVLAASLMGLSLFINPTKYDITLLIFGIIEDFLFFMIGYSIFKNNKDISRYVTIVLIFPVIGCLIALLNFVTGFPAWIAPDQLANYENMSNYEMYPLWATGFSWHRNGWGCTLSVLLPLCFLLPKNNKYALFYYVVILASIFICGNRNGLVAAVLSLLLLMTKYKSMQNEFVSIRILLVFIVIGLMMFGSSFVVSSLRLHSGDLSAGRIDQYVLIPEMFKEMKFWGLGHNGTMEFLARNGLGFHLLHNTYFKILLEYGWLVGILMLGIVIDAIKKIIRAFSSNNKSQIVAAMILVSGLSLGLFEPMTIFGVYGGYAIWWLAFGYLSKVQIQTNK